MQLKRILVVDDEAGSARLLRANLELTERFKVRVESDPEAALGAARSFRPHLLVLDVVMPKVSGIQVAARVREDPELKTIPILFLTAAPANYITAQAQPQTGGLPYLSKPARMDEIMSKINEILAPPPEPDPDPAGGYTNEGRGE